MGWVSSKEAKNRSAAHLRRGCLAALCFLVAGCAQKGEPLVAGTALIQCVVQDLLQEENPPPALVPPGSCPGHYDMRPSDVARVAACEALLLHPWQEQLANVANVVRASGIPPENVVVVPVPGNWMVPTAYADALQSVAGVLETKGFDGLEGVSERAGQRTSEVRLLGRDLQDRLKTGGAAETTVLCQDMIAPFVTWAGFSVAGSFGRSEDLSVGDVEALVQLGKSRGVLLIIDNLQSGDEKMGAALARETGADRVVISNFPGAFPDTGTWDRAVSKNVELLLDALARVQAVSM